MRQSGNRFSARIPPAIGTRSRCLRSCCGVAHGVEQNPGQPGGEGIVAGFSPSITLASSKRSQIISSNFSLSGVPTFVARARISGWPGLISSTGFDAGPSRPLSASIRSSRRSGPLSERRDKQGSSTACQRRVRPRPLHRELVSSVRKASQDRPPLEARLWPRPVAPFKGMDLMSAAPCVTDLKGLPSKPTAVATQKASTGSGNSKTSIPLARNPSSCGLADRRYKSSPRR